MSGIMVFISVLSTLVGFVLAFLESGVTGAANAAADNVIPAGPFAAALHRLREWFGMLSEVKEAIEDDAGGDKDEDARGSIETAGSKNPMVPMAESSRKQVLV